MMVVGVGVLLVEIECCGGDVGVDGVVVVGGGGVMVVVGGGVGGGVVVIVVVIGGAAGGGAGIYQCAGGADCECGGGDVGDDGGDGCGAVISLLVTFHVIFVLYNRHFKVT